MISENKVGKYLKYAIGEIILVVIGILIALQLNDYNDQLKQKRLEQETLHNLKLDFEYNLSAMEKVAQLLTFNRDASLKMINYTGNNYSDHFIVDSLIEVVVHTPQYFPQNGFLLELINSGNLGVISNDILRNRLSSWLPTLETLKEREQFSSEFSKDVIRYIVKNGSWLNIDQVSLDEQILSIHFPKSGFDIDNNQMLLDPEFENLLENQIANQTVLLERQERCIKLNKEIVQLLKLEIKE